MIAYCVYNHLKIIIKDIKAVLHVIFIFRHNRVQKCSKYPRIE